jgi:hypothetical protein
MSRGSFSRTVARAAASGGSRAYRGRSPRGWYGLVTMICALGVFLIVYSRNEYLHPYHAPAVPPTASDHWYAALGIDLCGKMQPNLPANPDFSSVGIRTAGDGVILVAPGAVSNSSSYTGKHDTLGTFASSYTGMTLTSTSLQLPGKALLKDGDRCTAKLGPLSGAARLAVETWSSPHAKTGTVYRGDPTKLKLLNGMMVTLGFVPPGTRLPEPPSKSALLGDLNGTAVSAPPTTPTTTTTTLAPTTTTKPGSSVSTTVAPAKGAPTTAVSGSAATPSTVASPAKSTSPAKASVSAVKPGSVKSPTTTIGATGVATH